MEKSATVTMRVNPDLKREAEILLADMGLTLSAAYNLFLKAVVNTHSIPFSIRTKDSDPFWSETNQKYLMESIKELEAGRGKEHEIIDA